MTGLKNCWNGDYGGRYAVAKTSNKGQVTVFLCILLMALVILAGVIVDVIRIVNGEAQAKRAVLSAAKSALSGFDSDLKEDYGIFAISERDSRRIRSTVESYLKKNLMISEIKEISDAEASDEGATNEGNINESNPDEEIPNLLDIYGFRIENIEVTPMLNLTENDTVRNQILQYMKYRAPKEIVEGIWERLSVVKEASDISEAYRMRYKVDKLLAEIDGVQQALKKNIDGDGSTGEFYVNGYNKGGIKHEMIYRFAEKAAQCCALGKSISELAAAKDELIELMAKTESEEEAARLAENMAQLDESIRLLCSQLDGAQRERDNIFRELRERHTRGFIQPNADAERNIKRIMEMAKEAGEEINRLERYLREDFEVEGELSASFKSTCEADIKKLKELAAQGSESEKILDYVDENIKLLNDELGKLEQVESVVRTEQDPERIRQTVLRLLTENVQKYNNRIDYDYERPVKQGDVSDPRKGLQDRIGKALKNDENEGGGQQDRDIKESGIDMELLPSKRKVKSPSFDAEDWRYLKSMEYGDNYSEPESSASGLYEVAYGGNLEGVDREADFYDKQGMFAENAFSFLGSMGKILGKGLSSLRDEIYINEYIMGMFKNSVPVLKYDNGEKKDVDLSGVDKSMRETFFESEVEYILHGKSSESANKLLTKSQILLIRFGMNTIHVYSDVKKKEFATAVATAIAGWWTGGAGIPLLSNLIMCSWGMAEAIIDLNDLMDGKSVPFYKKGGDWKLDIGIPGLDGMKTDSRLCFSYHDYLRLFLLLKNPDEKIGRIEDLIQLNMMKHDQSFEMACSHTCIRIEAEFSIRYMFFTGMFIPPEKKTKDGRHLIRVVLYEYY